MKPTKEQIQDAINTLSKEIEEIRKSQENLREKNEKLKTLLEKKNIFLVALENLKRM